MNAQLWSDLGSGSGLFSLALATLLPQHSTIICMDEAKQSLGGIAGNEVSLEFIRADFSTYEFEKDKFNGFIMANSLHFIKDKAALVGRLIKGLSPNGRIVIIEYDTDSANNWVPFPISYERLVTTFPDLSIKKIGERPSRFGRTMYCCEMVP